MNSKLRELTDDELAQVYGGVTNNGDGTYNVEYGDTFYSSTGFHAYTACQNYENITLDTVIVINVLELLPGGTAFIGPYTDYDGNVHVTLGRLLHAPGYSPF